MAVSYFQFVFATFLLSCLSAGLLIGSMATEDWVKGELVKKNENLPDDLINYGLFKGTFTARNPIPNTNVLYVSCIYGENVCAYSCEKTSEKRKTEMQALLNEELPDYICNTAIKPEIDKFPGDIVWFNSGVYLTVIILCGLSILLAIFSALLGVYNTSKIAIEPMLGIFGLYIWHGIAIIFEVLILILWGVHFETNVKEQLAFIYTMSIRTYYERFETEIGFSYWFIFGAMICSILAEISLIVRWWKIKTAPPPPTVALENNTDNTIFLY